MVKQKRLSPTGKKVLDRISNLTRGGKPEKAVDYLIDISKGDYEGIYHQLTPADKQYLGRLGLSILKKDRLEKSTPDEKVVKLEKQAMGIQKKYGLFEERNMQGDPLTRRKLFGYQSSKFFSPKKNQEGYRKNMVEWDRKIHGGLDKKVSLPIAIICLLGAGIFFSPNLTGNVIGNLNSTTSNIIGVGLFLVGLIGVFYYSRGKNKKVKG